MHTQRLTLSVLAVTGLLTTAACGTESGDDQSASVGAGQKSAITGKHWKVETVSVGGTTYDAPAEAHIEFGEDGKVGGNYGCNHFGATAEMKGDTIKVGPDTLQTKMACGDKPMEFESKIAEALSDSTIKTEVNGDKLTLTTQDGQTVKLTTEEPAKLVGTKWNVTGSTNKGGTVTALASEAEGKVHLTFDGKDSVRGQLGCNKVTAKATVSDGRITLGSPSTTRMMCSPSLMDTEKALLKLFDGPVSYELKHRTLTLTSENGTGLEAVAAK
ncbi:META domain-containing protein [Streptomyces sp. HC44]|uniref:META domain-containing protein n=1 Tax=Streptomyces scabichelini TaxID=2711217 RepID=A0A6G4VG95_9ACTN|nr:META domain-containing protein [Streptomyces scabichelini]NGO12807.1 META domain-containing protein [Streptomyces scabichelini]